MKRLKLTSILAFLVIGTSVAQIDNATDYISNSLNEKLAANSQCDIIYTKDGSTISAIIKDTLADKVTYKICKNYGTNATLKSGVISIANSKIEKIVFSNQLVIKFKGNVAKNIKLNSLVKKKEFKFKNRWNDKLTEFENVKNKKNKPEFNFEKKNFLFLSGGSNQFAEAFTEIGFLRQKSKNFAIGTSFSFMRSPYKYDSYYEYVTTYDYVGIGSGPYSSYGTYVGTAGYSSYWNGSSYSYMYDGVGPYNSSGNYIGTYGGYEENSSNQLVINDIPQITSFNLFVDLKFNFLAKKRVQPFIISSYGGTLRSVGYISSTNYYDEGFKIGLRFASGIDFFTKNKKTIFSLMTNLSSDYDFEAIFGARISFKL